MGLFDGAALQVYVKLVDTLRAEATDREERFTREREAWAKERADLLQRLMTLTNPDALRRASAPPPRPVGMMHPVGPPSVEMPEFYDIDLPDAIPTRPVPPGWGMNEHPEHKEIAERRALARQAKDAQRGNGGAKA